MAPVTTFSGSLVPKKKAELQEIASALRLDDKGTRDDLQTRIKQHLEDNQDKLEDDPVFSGLYGNLRKRSVQPQPLAKEVELGNKPLSSRFAQPPSVQTATTTRSSWKPRAKAIPLDPIAESTPIKDLRDISMQLKDVRALEITPVGTRTETNGAGDTPSSLPPLPPSPSSAISGNRSFNRSIIDQIGNFQNALSGFIHRTPTNSGSVQAQSDQGQRAGAVTKVNDADGAIEKVDELVVQTRKFLSDSRNIWSVNCVFELVYILSSIIQWRYRELPLLSHNSTFIPASISLPYTPWESLRATLQSDVFWLVLAHWFIPTLLVPTIIGHLVSFHPVKTQRYSYNAVPTKPLRKTTAALLPFDPLTASIVRLAMHVLYPYSRWQMVPPVKSYGTTSGHQWTTTIESVFLGRQFDVLGYQWRIVGAAVGVAFAFAEAVSGGAEVVVREIRRGRAPAVSADEQAEEASPSSVGRLTRESGRRLILED